MLRRRLGRPAAAVALTLGLAVVAGLIAIVATSVLAQYDELADSVSQAVDDIRNWLEEPRLGVLVVRRVRVRSSRGADSA